LHTVKATRLAAYGGISQEQESKMSLDEMIDGKLI
jgi:hypothetical protein